MKRAFTLVELMVVVGLMGLMATIAIGSYSAAKRGMNDRAALDAAKTVADAAVQRANLDRTKVYLYLFNEVLRLDSEMSAGVACGVMVAVRPIGRITKVDGDLLCDEFNDLDTTYGTLKEADESDESDGEKEKNAATFRLFRLGEKAFAVVREGVVSTEVTGNDLEDGKQRTWKVHGFKKVSGTTFGVGDLYGQEFAVTRLPPGYVFSKDVQMKSVSDLGQKLSDVITIEPTDDRLNSEVKVYLRLPDDTFADLGDIRQIKDSNLK